MIERNTTIFCVLDPSAIEDINQDAFVSTHRPLGATVAAVNTMCACDEEMKFLLPTLIGKSPNSNDTNWAQEVANYWFNVNLDVPMTGGFKLDNSLIVDIYDMNRKSYLDSLCKTLKVGGSDEEKITAIEAYLSLDTTPETIKYRYSVPVNIEQYLLWRYCIVSNRVANDPDDVKKSNRIQFFLMDESKIEAKRKASNELRKKAIMAYSNLLAEKNSSKILNIMIALDLIYGINDIKAYEKDSSELDNMLFNIATTKPNRFLSIMDNKNLTLIAEIKKLVMAKVVSIVPGTSIYRDANDPAIVLGNKLEDVITYFSQDSNLVYVNELRLKAKQFNI